MPPKRTVTLRQDSPSFGDPASSFSRRKRLTATLPDWRLQSVGARVALAQAVRAMPATDFYTCRLTSLPMRTAGRTPQSVFAHWRSAEAWYRDDPSVTRRRVSTPVSASIARTSPRRDVTVVSLVSLCLSSCACVLNLFAWGSGVGSAGVQPMRNTQADGAPKVPGAGGHRLRRRLSARSPEPCARHLRHRTSSRRPLHFLLLELATPIYQLGACRDLIPFQVSPQGNE